jgi:hypothetical protein
MLILNPISDTSPNPDCPHCGGEGVPQSLAHRFLADEFSNNACPHCWEDEDDEDDAP